MYFCLVTILLLFSPPFQGIGRKETPFYLAFLLDYLPEKCCECPSDWVQLPVSSLSAGGLSWAAGMDTLSETDSTPAPTAARDGNVWKRHLWVSAEPIFTKQSFRLVAQSWQTSCMLKWEGRALILWNYEKWTQNGEIERRKSCAG